MTITETLDAIKTLRAMGARRVRVGEVEVEFPAPVLVEPQEQPLPPEVLAERERADYERTLFHSAL